MLEKGDMRMARPNGKDQGVANFLSLNEGQDCSALKRANDELAFDVFGPKRNWRKRKRGREQKEETPDNQR